MTTNLKELLDKYTLEEIMTALYDSADDPFSLHKAFAELSSGLCSKRLKLILMAINDEVMAVAEAADHVCPVVVFGLLELAAEPMTKVEIYQLRDMILEHIREASEQE